MYSDALVSVSILNIVRMICCLIILLAVLFSAPIRKRKPLFAAVGILGMIMLVAMVVLSHFGNVLLIDDEEYDEYADLDEYQEEDFDFDLYPDETPEEYLVENYSEDAEGDAESEAQGEYYTDLYNSFAQNGNELDTEEGTDEILDPYSNANNDTTDRYDDAYEESESTERSSGRTSGRQSNGDYAFPEMNGSTYESNVLGVGYTIGKRWKYADSDKLASHDGVSTSNFYNKLSSDIMSGNGYRSEMFAESDDGYKTVGVTVVYSGVTGSSAVSAELDSMVGSSGFYDRSAVAKKYGASSAEVSVSNSVFCGKKARKVHLVASYSSGQVLYSDVIIFANDGFIGIITANSVNEDDSSLLDNFYDL